MDKMGLADQWVTDFDIYTDFFNEYVDTFKLSLLQTAALRRLLELAVDEKMSYIAAAQAGLTCDDMFRMTKEAPPEELQLQPTA